MTRRPLLACLRLALVASAVPFVTAQKCYYPNGQEAADSEKPCSSAEGSACCPDKWECLDNGLCHYPPDNLWGRYSCTDQSWDSPGCASNMCTYNMNALGGESITQCSDHDNQWCCNADATHVDCCKESPEPRPFFSLPSGKAYATIGASTASNAPTLNTLTGLAEGTSSGSNPSSTPPPDSSNSPPSSNAASSKGSSSKDASATPTGPTTPITSLQTSVASDTGGIHTIVITSVIQPPAQATNNPPSASHSDKSSKVPVIVGCAVGIPLGLALIGILAWLFRKQHKQHKEKNAYGGFDSPTPFSGAAAMDSPEFAGGANFHKPSATTYRNEAGVPELGGQSVGPGRPISVIQGKAELESGGGFAPGAVPMAPHLVGVGGGNHTPQSSWGSAPPGYSPSQNAGVWGSPNPNQNGHAFGQGGVQEQGAAVTEGGRYVPYRPPASQQLHTAPGAGMPLSGVPEVAELSGAPSPPERGGQQLEIRNPDA